MNSTNINISDNSKLLIFKCFPNKITTITQSSPMTENRELYLILKAIVYNSKDQIGDKVNTQQHIQDKEQAIPT